MPLEPPPLRPDGTVEPHNHRQIADRDYIIRRVSPQYVVHDAKIGGKRLSTMAFQPSNGADQSMSVDIEKLIAEAGHDPRKYVVQPPYIGAVAFTAGSLRSMSLMVGYEPVPLNPHHGGVWGNFTKGVQRRLCAEASIYAPIPGMP